MNHILSYSKTLEAADTNPTTSNTNWILFVKVFVTNSWPSFWLKVIFRCDLSNVFYNNFKCLPNIVYAWILANMNDTLRV